jgi:NAD(P)-dependent dehydrogenase (short-subunit alcohol dehydrogenase family)
MSKIFLGRTALVTGSGSGIGKATALEFAREGATVIVADINHVAGKETAEEIVNLGGSSVFVKTDVSRAEDVEYLVSYAVDRYGHLDIAHNNAGTEGVIAELSDLTEEEWDRTINVNLKSVWLCMKYEIRQMKRQGKGVIVNTSSLAGLVGIPSQSAYCASKGGVVQLTRAAALECARSGIRVNAVCPGHVQTPMSDRLPKDLRDKIMANQPIGRIGTPQEIASAVVWLCSDSASFITGHPLVVDGGSYAQ